MFSGQLMTFHSLTRHGLVREPRNCKEKMSKSFNCEAALSWSVRCLREVSWLVSAVYLRGLECPSNFPKTPILPKHISSIHNSISAFNEVFLSLEWATWIRVSIITPIIVRTTFTLPDDALMIHTCWPSVTPPVLKEIVESTPSASGANPPFTFNWWDQIKEECREMTGDHWLESAFWVSMVEAVRLSIRRTWTKLVKAGRSH